MNKIHIGGSYQECWTPERLRIEYKGGRNVSADDVMTAPEREYFDAAESVRFGKPPEHISPLLVCEAFRFLLDDCAVTWDRACTDMENLYGNQWWKMLNTKELPPEMHSIQPRLWDLSAYVFQTFAMQSLQQSVHFHYTDSAYTEPVGAVPCGTAVKLRISVQIDLVYSVHCILSQKALPTHMEGRFYALTCQTPLHPVVLFYQWKLETACGTVYLCAPSPGSCKTVLQVSPGYDFQITAYCPGLQTPEWFQKTILYQIFPDRFARGSREQVQSGIETHRKKGRSLTLCESWEQPVKWRNSSGSGYTPDDLYGGTLSAIKAHLPYLYELGVGAIYLNPVFEANSNHRYNTADYKKIDPVLGTESDFKELCRAARALGIRIILDGVFSHTGEDSIYFSGSRDTGVPGAVAGPGSPYYSWYQFDDQRPGQYKCWWGFSSLPEVNEEDPGWQEYVISGADSVVRHWLRAGCSGYRLDVADELPDDVIEKIRCAVKGENPENILIGEVWEDATTKVSYGHRRTYALGQGLDSVMNYPLRNALVDFVLHRSSAEDFCDFLWGQRLHYPPPIYAALMNLLSSHDIARIGSVLASRIDGDSMTREQQASFILTEEQKARGYTLQKICASVLYSLPGVPSIYYGDETGMLGWRDPFNRETFRCPQPELVEYYRKLGKIRLEESALSDGTAAFFPLDEHVILIERKNARQTLCLLANVSEQPYTYLFANSEIKAPISLLGTGALAAHPEGIAVTIPGMSSEMLRINIH